jgi:hypothetical protein
LDGFQDVGGLHRFSQCTSVLFVAGFRGQSDCPITSPAEQSQEFVWKPVGTQRRCGKRQPVPDQMLGESHQLGVIGNRGAHETHFLDSRPVFVDQTANLGRGPEPGRPDPVGDDAEPAPVTASSAHFDQKRPAELILVCQDDCVAGAICKLFDSAVRDLESIFRETERRNVQAWRSREMLKYALTIVPSQGQSLGDRGNHAFAFAYADHVRKFLSDCRV